MFQLLVIADDFTGALDTGVQFAVNGIRTRVVVDPKTDLTGCEADVLVVDTETRHLPPEEAAAVVGGLTGRAVAAGVERIYKKTDSALRGNVGAELESVLKASGQTFLPFLPAFPQMGRITRGGIHYIDGVPVTESPFGKDPFEPVTHSAVTELVREQSSLPVSHFPALRQGERIPLAEGILIFDAEREEELITTGHQLLTQTGLPVMAGCAGFGSVLPQLLGMKKQETVPAPKLDPRLLVICGSVNTITLAQLDRAENAGFARMRLTPRQKLEQGYWESDEGKEELKQIEAFVENHPHAMIETNDPGGNEPTAAYAGLLGLDREAMRVRIAGSLGHMVKALIAGPGVGTLLLTGGDTLLQCMNCIGVRELEPVCELEKGIVLARFAWEGCPRYVITKSGGFGQEQLFTKLAERIKNS